METIEVWSVTLDERFVCKVVRTGDYTGKLSIFDPNQLGVIYEEDVALSYGAMFGPDVGDVQEWQNKILKIVDGLKQ